MKKKIHSLFSFSSIRAKLIWILVLLGGLPVLVAGFLFYNSAANALLFQTRQQLGNVAEKTAQQIDNFMQVSRKEITLLSDFPFVQLAFLQFEFNQRLDTVKSHLEDYSKKNNYFNDIHLIDLEGKPILSLNRSDTTEAISFKDDEWFIQTLKNGIHLSDLSFFTRGTAGGLMLGKTVYDFEDANRVVGVLAFDIKQSAFAHYVAGVRIGSRGFGFLMHASGFLIYHPDGSLVMVDTKEMGDERMQHLIQGMKEGKSGFGNYTFRGDEKYLVYRPCKEKNWSVGVTVFKSELMADIYRFRRRMITFFLLLTALILPVSYFFIKSITTPIRRLIKGVAAIGSGNLDYVITVRSNDELQEVASEFNKMALTLKDSMEEILELKTFYEDTLRNVTNGIITVDRSGNITSLNASAQKILDFVPASDFVAWSETLPEPVRQVMSLLSQTLKNGKGLLDHELTVRGRDHKEANLEINTSLLSNKLGKIFGAIADVRDITRRKRMEEAVIRVDKLASLGELSAGVAHEIRNPLAGIKTSVQVLTKRIQEPEQKELIEGILIEINRLNNMVTNLLLFSRPAQPVVETVDIASVIDETLHLVTERIRQTGIILVKDYQADLKLVTVDRGQIRQILLNLFLNSIRAMEQGGRLTIRVNQSTHPGSHMNKPVRFGHSKVGGGAGFVEVVIEDTGTGIKKENITKIFNPFFTTNPRGTGLGLSIVHQLLEKNDGTIVVESQEASGTQVTLLLPVEQGQSEQSL